jgi:hypothetical protein
MDEILESHLIDPASLRADDFLAFIKARERALLDRVEAVMGKPIVRDYAPPQADEPADYEEEEESEQESDA